MTPRAEAVLLAGLAKETDDCVLWPLSVRRDGYGQIRRGGTMIAVHRVACEAANGPAPEGTEAAHSCNVKRCFNKRHLRWATRRENLQDRVLAGAHVEGEKHGNAVLDEKTVLAIRAEKGTLVQVAAKFGVSYGHVGRIKRREQWDHL